MKCGHLLVPKTTSSESGWQSMRKTRRLWESTLAQAHAQAPSSNVRLYLRSIGSVRSVSPIFGRRMSKYFPASGIVRLVHRVEKPVTSNGSITLYVNGLGAWFAKRCQIGAGVGCRGVAMDESRGLFKGRLVSSHFMS